jgi:hypothetical protein
MKKLCNQIGQVSVTEFIDMLHDAGWVTHGDAQYENITKLYDELVILQLQSIDQTLPNRPSCVKDEYLEYLDSVWAADGTTSYQTIQDIFDITLDEAKLVVDYWDMAFNMRHD